jgi:receptor expression-enhancing protein 1/2/3/4
MFAESYTPLISWLPLYSTARLLFLTWLVLPQTQGATFLYQAYVSPFLVDNEARIDRAIGDAHEKIKAAGGDSVRKLIEWVERSVFGREPVHQAQNVPADNYAQSLLARFSIPIPGFPTPTATTPTPPVAQTNDLSALLNSFTSTLGLSSLHPTIPSAVSNPATRESQISALAANATLIPPSLNSLAERVDFVSQQRERLRVLLGALDREASELAIQRDVDKRVSHGPGGLSKSRSEVSLEVVEHEDNEDEEDDDDVEQKGIAKKGGWMSGWWGGEGVKAPATAKKSDADLAYGSSSAVDR